MKMVPDNTHRFAERPYYDAGELDQDCETLVETFLLKRHREVRYPIATDDLTVLIEQSASLDSSIDLSRHGAKVDGRTVFFADDEPEVSISDRLSAAFLETAFVRPWPTSMAMCTFTDLFGRPNSGPAFLTSATRLFRTVTVTPSWMAPTGWSGRLAMFPVRYSCLPRLPADLCRIFASFAAGMPTSI